MEQRQTYLITVNTEELLPGISERLETLLIDKDAYTKQFYRDIIKNGFEFVFIETIVIQILWESLFMVIFEILFLE